MKCPRCSFEQMQRMTDNLAQDQDFWCTVCNGWITHQLRDGKLWIEFADWRCNGWKENSKISE